jgi:hypothetical protein
MINRVCNTIVSRFIVVSIVWLTIGFVSCKKEYVDKINTIPGDTTHISGMNYIKTFEIKEYSTDTVIKASITADSIFIYWPSYSRALPDSIAPVIALPDSATISPASGKKVAFRTGAVYTVTSAAGTIRKYILKVSQLSAVPWFSFSSPGITLGDYITLPGDQFWQDTSQTKVYFVSATTGTAYQAELFVVGMGGPRFIVPLNVPANELYDIKVVNGPYTIYNALEARRNAVNLVYPTAATLNAAGLPSKLARGAEFTVRGVLLEKTATASLYAGGVYTPIDVISVAADRVVLKIPAGVAAGVYTRIRVVTSDALTRFLTALSITVTE